MAEESSNLIKLARKKRHIHLVEKLGKGSLSQKEMDELAEYEKEAEGQVTVLADGTVDLVTIAVYLEKSVKSIRRYVDAGLPAVKSPTGEILRFKVSDAFKWFYSREGYDDGSRTKWDIEYRKNKAKLSEIELKEKERELIEHMQKIQDEIKKKEQVFEQDKEIQTVLKDAKKSKKDELQFDNAL